MATEVQNYCGKTVDPETIRRVFRENGYNGRVARKKPYINEQNRKKRLEFAKNIKDKDLDYWKMVIFADESKYNVFGSDGRGKVWRKVNTELNKENLLPTVKHGGGSVMVWGCMSHAGVGNLVFIEGIMDRMVYLDLLQQNLRQSAEKMGILRTFQFYQDNDPKHKSRVVQEWLLYNCPKVLQTPPQSPDLNPIENLWEILDRGVRKHTISSKTDLKRVLLEEWNKITAATTQKLVESMGRRLKNVIQQKGYPTKY